MYRTVLRIKIVLLAICVAATLFGCQSKSGSNSAKTNTNNTTSSQNHKKWEGEYKTVGGDWDALKKIIDSHRGKIVVLDIGATYEPDCVKGLPGLIALQKKHNDDIVCIVVNFDCPQSEETSPAETKIQRDEVDQILRKQMGTVLQPQEAISQQFQLFISQIDTEEFYEATKKSYGETNQVNGMPTVMVFDRAGHLTKFEGGKNDPLSYQKHVSPFVEKLMKK